MIFRLGRSIKLRFIVSIAAMILPLLVLGATTYISINRVVDGFGNVVEHPHTELREVSRTQVAVSAAVMPPNDWLIHGDKSERQKFEQLSAEVENQFAILKKIIGHEHEEQSAVDTAYRNWQIAKVQATELLAIANPVGNPRAGTMMERMDAQFDKVLTELEIANRLATLEANTALEKARDIRSDAIQKAVLAMLVGLIVAIAVGWYLMYSLVRPIQALHRSIQQFGRGKLDERANVYGRDEVGKLASAFNDMAHQVQNVTETLAEESIHDPLTGALNRREMERQFARLLQHAIRHNQPLTVAMVDLDHFKQINDTHGHQVGDELLKNFCTMMESNLRPGDVFARYGGEEFIVLLPDSDGFGARRVAERLRLLAAGSGVKRNGKTITITVSIGLSTFPADGATVEGLMAAADRALYGAKAAGRDRVESAQEI